MPENSKSPEAPLCVDLDGTLIRTDVLWESLLQLIKQNPAFLLALPFWIMRGRAYFKQQIASRVQLDVAVLPYHQGFLDYIRSEHQRGRNLILATAADHRLAIRVAEHVGLFSEVLASDGRINMRGHNKVRHLAEKFGAKQFDYAGNSTVDLPVWAESRKAIVVNATEGLAQKARARTEVSHVFNDAPSKLKSLVKALRPHQWVKNIIIFVPLLTSHMLEKVDLMMNACLAFVAFSLCASGIYVMNDLLDLESDRHHATKRRRPFAAGALEIPIGFALIPACLAASGILACILSWKFVLVLAAYFVLTTSYSVRVKQIALLDVFFLAGLYTMRLIAGHAATAIHYSFWLLAFSMFIFLSLALVKRFTELNALRQKNAQETRGRGYKSTDLEIVGALGIASGCMAVLVMALYVNSPEVRVLYPNHQIRLLLVCPLLMYWISRVWLVAHRGEMHDDPIVFALKDRVSYLIGALTLGALWLASVSW